ncbi:MAG TPA: hypothetical protein VKT29_15075 [Terriglobales bacterium]|nr:hypothetical protein [Terriglobales bacterium]
MVDGKFYDASIYRADPSPMALDPGVVYEAERNGSSAGLFTVGNALQVGHNWYGLGQWQSSQDLQAAKEARAKQEAQAKAAQKVEAQDEDSGPPVLRRPSNEKQPAPNSPSKAPQMPPQPQQTAKATPPPPPAAAPPPPSSPDEYDPNRPVLRRGAPVAASKADETWSPDETTTSASKNGKQSAPSGPKIEQMPAVSDADGPELRPYTFDLKPEERDADYKKMLGYAQDAVTKYERLRHSDFSSAQLGENEFHFFDVDLSNQPVFVLTAPATVNFGATPRHPTRRRGTRTTTQLNETAPGKQEQAYVTVVGRVDLYGELKPIFSSITDSLHLDEIPRLQLIDAVDVDGDGRGELLFQETTDSGKGYIIYRVTPDQLTQLFDTLGPED